MKIIFSYKFWLYYCAVLAGVLIVFGVYLSYSNPSLNLKVANWLFVPVVLFFLLAVSKFRRHNNSAQPGMASFKLGLVLLVYSMLLCAIITIGGFITTRSTQELVSNIIFLPITIFCWYIFYTRPKKSQGLVSKTTGAILKTITNTGQQNESRGVSNQAAVKASPFNSQRMQNKNWEISELEKE